MESVPPEDDALGFPSAGTRTRPAVTSLKEKPQVRRFEGSMIAGLLCGAERVEGAPKTGLYRRRFHALMRMLMQDGSQPHVEGEGGNGDTTGKIGWTDIDSRH